MRPAPGLASAPLPFSRTPTGPIAARPALRQNGGDVVRGADGAGSHDRFAFRTKHHSSGRFRSFRPFVPPPPPSRYRVRGSVQLRDFEVLSATEKPTRAHPRHRNFAGLPRSAAGFEPRAARVRRLSASVERRRTVHGPRRRQSGRTGADYRPGGPSTTSGTTAPSTAPMISAELPAPRKETSSPASEPMPAPTTAIMSRFATILFLHRAG